MTHTKTPKQTLIKQFALFFLIAISFNIQATETTLKKIVDSDAENQLIIEAKLSEDEIVAGTTPLSSILAIQKALSTKDYQEAAKYFDFRYLPDEVAQLGEKVIIQRMVSVWSQQKILELSSISDSPKGHLDDKLPSYRDYLGSLKSKQVNVPIYIQLVPDKTLGKKWKVSNYTLSKLPELWQEFGYNAFAASLEKYLPEFTLFNMQNWQFTSLIIIIIFSFLAAKLLKTIALIIIRPYPKHQEELQRFIKTPIRLFIFLYLIHFGASHLGLSIQAKVWIDSGLLTNLATLFLTIGLLNLFTTMWLKSTDSSTYSANILRPISTTIKFIIIIGFLLSWLADAGYNITTIMTGLGIGSLALALAAQKTLENVFGAFTLYITRPIKPGDACRFGDIFGTVEEIGLRSTRIRKLDQTIVHIPNSVFSSQSLQSYSEIAKRRYVKDIRIRLETTPNQIRQLVIALNELMISHEKIAQEQATRVRFKEIERDAFLINIVGYIETASLFESEEISEDLNLKILEILNQKGIKLAIPEQTLHLDRNHTTDSELVKMADQQMINLAESNELPIPRHSESQKTALQGSITYPPKGSAIEPKNEN